MKHRAGQEQRRDSVVNLAHEAPAAAPGCVLGCLFLPTNFSRHATAEAGTAEAG